MGKIRAKRPFISTTNIYLDSTASLDPLFGSTFYVQKQVLYGHFENDDAPSNDNNAFIGRCVANPF